MPVTLTPPLGSGHLNYRRPPSGSSRQVSMSPRGAPVEASRMRGVRGGGLQIGDAARWLPAHNSALYCCGEQ